MRFKKIFAIFFSCLMMMSLAAFAACNYNGNPVIEGFDLDDPDTWFDEEKTDLPTLTQCQKISVGMSFTEVVRKIGKPQRDLGYGTIWYQFDIDDGSVLNLWFNLDVDKEDKYVQNNPHSVYGTHFLYVSHIEFDQEKPDWYYHKSYNLNELYPWINELKEEDVVKVRYEQAFIGVAPGDFKDISYSTNEVDIENAYKLLSSSAEAISPAEGQIDGGGYVKYDFLTADGKTYSITISNGNLYIDNRYYRFVGNTYKFKSSERDCHSFITYVDTYEVYTYGNESVKIGEYDGLVGFEFQKYEGLLENTPSYRLKSFDKDLLILSDKQFIIEGDDNTVIYQITGDKDFSFLFAETND